MIQPAALAGNSDKENKPVSQEEGGPVSQQENKAVSQQVNEVDGDTIQTKVCQVLEKVKQLSEEASRHIFNRAGGSGRAARAIALPHFGLNCHVTWIYLHYNIMINSQL